MVDAEKHKTGPHLVNIMGRVAGSAGGYKRYSNAMKLSGIVWNEETLDGYLEKPNNYVRGTRMLFVGLRKEEDRANVIAYLKSYSKGLIPFIYDNLGINLVDFSSKSRIWM